MNLNSKKNCISDLSASILRTAKWRRGLQAKFPDDPRIGQAADMLDNLAVGVSDLSDQAWSELQTSYNWSSGTWADAVSKTSRLVGFRHVNTLPEFVTILVGILSESSVAA